VRSNIKENLIGHQFTRASVVCCDGPLHGRQGKFVLKILTCRTTKTVRLIHCRAIFMNKTDVLSELYRQIF
jgi:hypothetical protein